MNLKNNEGVVALKALTNGLVAALFSNGFLRVVRANDGCVVAEMKLITEGKILEAMFASKSLKPIPGEFGYHKTILIAAAFTHDLLQVKSNYL